MVVVVVVVGGGGGGGGENNLKWIKRKGGWTSILVLHSLCCFIAKGSNEGTRTILQVSKYSSCPCEGVRACVGGYTCQL